MANLLLKSFWKRAIEGILEKNITPKLKKYVNLLRKTFSSKVDLTNKSKLVSQVSGHVLKYYYIRVYITLGNKDLLAEPEHFKKIKGFSKWAEHVK